MQRKKMIREEITTIGPRVYQESEGNNATRDFGETADTRKDVRDEE